VKALVDITVPATTFILLVAVGLGLTLDDFARIARKRTLVLVGLFAPLVFLPPIAVALIRVFHAAPDLAAGILLIAACPVGSVSNMYTYLARGSTAVSVALTGLSSLLASLTIPVIGKAIETLLAQPFDLKAPPSVLATQLLLVLALPVVLGMWVRPRFPELARRIAPALQRLSLIGILLIFALVILANPGPFFAGLTTAVPLAAAFVIASIVVGWVTAWFITADAGERFAVAAEFGARNVAIATAIAVTILGRIEFARFAATYALIEVPLMLGAVALFKMTRGRAGF
jgi:BASS family bile acid:Na+ symporter